MVEQSLALQAVLACLAGGGAYISSRDPSNDKRPPAGNVPKDRIFERMDQNTVWKWFRYAVWRGIPFINLAQGGYLLYLAYNPNKIKRFPIKYSLPFFGCSIVGPAWRYWCFRTLDRHFTFRLQVQKGQKIVKTGPYRYLAHPSYLGQFVNQIGIAGATVGPFNVLLNYFSLKPLYKLRTPLPLVDYFGKWIRISPRSLAQTTACITGFLFALSFYNIQSDRIADEEAMMREHFGEEYDEYLANRWRICPFIY